MACSWDNAWVEQHDSSLDDNQIEDIENDIVMENVDHASPDVDTSIYKLETLAKYNEFIAKEYGIIIFFANWCKICHHTHQDVRQFLSKNLIPGIKIAVVDCTKVNEIGKTKKILGVPSYVIAQQSTEEILLPPGTSFVKAFKKLQESIK